MTKGVMTMVTSTCHTCHKKIELIVPEDFADSFKDAIRAQCNQCLVVSKWKRIEESH